MHVYLYFTPINLTKTIAGAYFLVCQVLCTPVDGTRLIFTNSLCQFTSKHDSGGVYLITTLCNDIHPSTFIFNNNFSNFQFFNLKKTFLYFKINLLVTSTYIIDGWSSIFELSISLWPCCCCCLNLN